MENERNGFSIIGFIAQVLVILLFVFVLMWLFPTKSYIDNNNNNNATGTLLFNQNLLSMKDAGREYFTVSRMPNKENESKTLTLDEMIQKSMVVDLVDANGNKCDTAASFIKVTKVGSEYEMEVSLTCSGTTKKIKTTIGCYDYCESGLCEKTEQVLYEYKKIVEATSNWSDWSSWSKTKVTETSTRKVETRIVKETATKVEEKDAVVSVKYTCPTGYALTNNNTACAKIVSTSVTVDPTISCPSGYSLNSAKTSCAKTTTSYNQTIVNYACSDSSYTVSGTSCVKTVSKTATPHIKVSFDCLDGACQTTSRIDYYYCTDSSYKLSGKTCVKTLYEDSYVESYSCPSGYKLNSKNECYKTSSTSANVIYACAAGYTLSGNTCAGIITSTTTIPSTANKAYSCASGTLNKNNKCDVTINTTTNVTQYRYKTLVKTDAKTYIKWSELENDTTLLKQGYKKTGNQKVTTIDCAK